MTYLKAEDEVWSVDSFETERAYFDPDLPFRVAEVRGDGKVKLYGYKDLVPSEKFEPVRRDGLPVGPRPARRFKVGDRVVTKVFLEGFNGTSWSAGSDSFVEEVSPDGMLLLDNTKGYVDPSYVQLRKPAPMSEAQQLSRIGDVLQKILEKLK